MFELISSVLTGFEDFWWGYVGVPTVLLLGLYLSFASKFVQFRKLPTVLRTFSNFMSSGEKDSHGVSPIRAFFACVGGCVGVGNIVGICTAVQIGGPGALFWIWVTACAGTIVKYSEVYLGVKYRVEDANGRYTGGPMYFLQQTFKSSWVPVTVALLLCFYGVEVFQFSIVTNTIADNWDLPKEWVIATFLVMILFASVGGVNRVGAISSAIIPFFVITYVGMGTWVLLQNVSEVPYIFQQVFTAAFTGSAALGGFTGTLISTVSQGVRRGCYTGDVGVGYASVIHSETSSHSPQKQASLVIFEIFADTFFVCTTSIMLILTTGVWNQPIPTAKLVQTVLGMYFPYMHLFMPFFLALIGYATINAYMCVGAKSAQFIAPKWGQKVFFAYAAVILPLFAYIDVGLAQTAMAISGGLLLVINSIGIFRMRHELSFDLDAGEIAQPEMAPEFRAP
jgi:AGCS family alanine or glycine:cation symporter